MFCAPPLGLFYHHSIHGHSLPGQANGHFTLLVGKHVARDEQNGGRSPSLSLSADLISTSQVVAVVMDMFTDVDLLSEVLEAAARRVPVYILLDEMNAQHFLDMADKCRVNLHHVDVSDQARGVEGKCLW